MMNIYEAQAVIESRRTRLDDFIHYGRDIMVNSNDIPLLSFISLT